VNFLPISAWLLLEVVSNFRKKFHSNVDEREREDERWVSVGAVCFFSEKKLEKLKEATQSNGNKTIKSP
jgi:hypothetical protein